MKQNYATEKTKWLGDFTHQMRSWPSNETLGVPHQFCEFLSFGSDVALPGLPTKKHIESGHERLLKVMKYYQICPQKNPTYRQVPQVEFYHLPIRASKKCNSVWPSNPYIQLSTHRTQRCFLLLYVGGPDVWHDATCCCLQHLTICFNFQHGKNQPVCRSGSYWKIVYKFIISLYLRVGKMCEL